MSDLEVHYDAPPTLGRFLGSDAFVRMAIGPFGSGKSSACCVEVPRRAAETPACRDGVRRSRWAIVRNTYRELEDTTRKTFAQWVPSELGEWSEQDFTFTMRFEDVVSEVMFRALDRPDHVKKLLSLELTGAYCNEAREIPKAVFDAIQGRVGRYPRIDDIPMDRWWKPGIFAYWHGVWGDTNPPDTDHWIYRIFEEEKPRVFIDVVNRLTGKAEKVERKFERFKQPGGRSRGAENLDHLQPGYYQTLALGKDADWIKVYIDGEYGFVREGRPVYPEWSDALHVAEVEPRQDLDIVVGQDFGLTPAAMLMQRDPADGQLQVFDELVSQDMGAVSFARELATLIKATYPGRRVRGWGDPAGEQRSQVDERTPFQVVRAAGLPISPAPTNDFTLRREAVAGPLSRLTLKARPALVVSPRCKTLRKAMGGGYCYRRVQIAGDERFHDKPDKNAYSHVAEALQYACVGEGEDKRTVHGGAVRRVTLPFKVKRSMGR